MEDYKVRLQAAFKRLHFTSSYDFVPPALEEDVLAFEAKFDVRLPEDYRWFITNLTNGIIPTDKWDFGLLKKHEWTDYKYSEQHCNPSVPFPLSKRMARESNDEHEDYPFETLRASISDLPLKSFRLGEISLRDNGCGSDDFLVIKGNEYGNIWVDDYSSNAEVYPCYNIRLEKHRFSFTDWLCEIVDGNHYN